MIQGIIIKELAKHPDDRGWLSEIYRSDETAYKPAMAYVSYSNYNFIRGPHEHRKQSDFFVFTGPGEFILYLWDNRKKSPTYKQRMRLEVGKKPISILIPPGVVHAYKCVSKNGGFNINLPDTLYRGEGKKEEVDEIRHENTPGTDFKPWD